MTTLALEGPAAPPRSNGELVFAEPWEGRAFGLVMALTDSGVIAYDVFRDALIGQIAVWESGQHAPGERYSYYRCWLQALEQVLGEHGLVAAGDVQDRAAAFALRPAGHDHAHADDDRSHGHAHDRDDHEH